MLPPYRVKSLLVDLGYNVERVEIASYQTSLNQIFKVFINENIYCFKFFNDHPVGYYNTSKSRLDFINSTTKKLSEKFPFVASPLVHITDSEVGNIFMWDWNELYRNDEGTFDNLFGDKISNEEMHKKRYHNLGKSLSDLHLSALEIQKKDDDQLYFKSLVNKIETISKMEKREGIFTNLTRSAFKKIQDLMKIWMKESNNYNVSILTETWIHRDIHPRNYRFEGTELNSIIDWDHMIYDFAIIDVLSLSRYLVVVNRSLALEFLDGYFQGEISISKELVHFILLGMYLIRSIYVIAGGVWKDDTSKMEYELFGNDKLVYELFEELLE